MPRGYFMAVEVWQASAPAFSAVELTGRKIGTLPQNFGSNSWLYHIPIEHWQGIAFPHEPIYNNILTLFYLATILFQAWGAPPSPTKPEGTWALYQALPSQAFL